jgi:hypothetical protein
MVRGWVAKRGRRDQLLGLIINGNSLVHALSEELEQDVCTHLSSHFLLGHAYATMYCHSSVIDSNFQFMSIEHISELDPDQTWICRVLSK